MKVPSCTLRMRTNAGLYVIDNVIVDIRDAPATEIGIVYGPLPTRISLGGLSEIRAGAPIGVCGGGGGNGAAGAAAGGGTGGGSSGATTAGEGAGGAAEGGGVVVIPGIGELAGNDGC